jgi:hypothetical protein
MLRFEPADIARLSIGNFLTILYYLKRSSLDLGILLFKLIASSEQLGTTVRFANNFMKLPPSA